MRSVLISASLGAVFCLAQPAFAAPITYDCQARMTRVEAIPPVAAGDANPWQCTLDKASKSSAATHWQRNSLEYCRLAVNAYDQALAAAGRIAKTHKPKTWVVLMDADETVLDNSLFDRERDRCAMPVQDAQWENWVHADMARDVPGAAAFTNAVHKLGGLVGIVTNRAQADDATTQATLKKAGIWFDYEIGMADKPDKVARWNGAVDHFRKAFGGHPRAVMWLGDQVTDLAIVDKTGAILRAMSEKDDGAGIGTYLFLLPNPMYGGWMKNDDD